MHSPGWEIVSETILLPLKSLKHLAAIACVVATQFLPAFAQYPKKINGPNDLAKAATDLLNTPDRGYHIINFAYYGNVGSFKLDSPTDRVESLTFQRSSVDSDGVIKVDNTFLDIKNMPGKIILKGLAFQLTTPKSVLISGLDPAKVNGSLLIDSCFIYADSLDNSFLTWWGANGSAIEIRNSYFVVKGGKAGSTKMLLTAPNVSFTNNLLNFSGSVSATSITKKFESRSNTVNKTQFELLGKLDAGALPAMDFSQNLFVHHGAVDAFGGTAFFALNFSNFNDLKVVVQFNKLYKTWNGFDFPAGARFSANSSNILIDTLAGKPSSELWNWYTESLDSNKTGLLSGDGKLVRYNVLPGDTSYSWSLGRGEIRMDCQPAIFPRQIRIDTTDIEAVSNKDSAGQRRVFPSIGVLQFGAFRTNRIIMGLAASFGKPTLLANDSLDKGNFTAQIGSGTVNANPSVYENTMPAARKFVLVNTGNTPVGNAIRPAIPDLNAQDKLLFTRVDSAGYTTLLSPAAQNLPKDLRSLRSNWKITTTAVVNSTVVIGAQENDSPYSSDKVYWLFKNPDTLIQAVKSPTGPDSLKYVATVKYNSAKGSLEAYLVEKLSVPRGGIVIPVSDGSVKAVSTAGFQLTIDSSYVVDTVAYGIPTKGYSFTWPLKAVLDSVTLVLKPRPDQDLFVKLGGGAPVLVGAVRDTNGNFTTQISEVNKGKVFFMAIEYNVVKDTPYLKVFPDTVQLSGFTSSTSGKLLYEPLSDALKESLNGVVKDYRFLGGKQMKAISLATINAKAPYDMQFATKGTQNASKVEAYTYDGQAWSPTPLTGTYTGGKFNVLQVPASTRAIAVIERLQAAETYVKVETKVVGNILTVASSYINDSIQNITGYCVELKWVNSVGTVEPEGCAVTDKMVINQPITKTLVPNAGYQIRIQYFIGEEKINGRQFEILPGISLSVNYAAEAADVAVKAKGRWNLIGFPVGGQFSKIMVNQHDAIPDTVKDSTAVMRIKKGPGPAVFQTITNLDSIQVKRGEAYLLASAHTFKTVVTAADTLSIKPDTLALDTGWNFIANPFPIDMVVGKIRTTLNRPLTFWRLDRSGPVGKGTYTWTRESTLRPFLGYAFHAKPGELLAFDPFADTLPGLNTLPAKVSAAGAVVAELEVRLESPWGASAMTISSLRGAESVPFLGTPGSGPQLRLGGGSGYMIKAVANAANIDEPVEIRSPANGSASFTLSRPFQAGTAMRLIDLRSGAVYDEAGAKSMAVSEGSQAFRLLAGDPAFVEARTQAFLSAAPAEINLSQNYPNPFRGRTNVELRWPAWQGGARTASLDVIDMQGRFFKHVDLGEVRVGRQVLTLDASTWSPGMYLYRLTVVTRDRSIHLQKRMLVSP